MVESVLLTEADRELVHAFQLAGRAPVSKIAAALGLSEQTVARRYRALRTAGLLRVVGMVVGPRLGYQPWSIRLRCTADAATAIATALARRPDTFWVNILSGGTEISCYTQPRTPAERDGLLLEKLPRTNRVLGMTAYSILHTWRTPADWSGLRALDPDTAAKLTPAAETPVDNDDPPITLGPADQAMLDVLAVDGRAGFPQLASVAGISESTARRRLEQLMRAKVLGFLVDVPLAALGFPVEARLWMSVAPAELTTAARALTEHDEVQFVAVSTGPTNLMASVVCRDTSQLYRYLSERVAAVDGIRTLDSAPVIRTVKRIGHLWTERKDPHHKPGEIRR